MMYYFLYTVSQIPSFSAHVFIHINGGEAITVDTGGMSGLRRPALVTVALAMCMLTGFVFFVGGLLKVYDFNSKITDHLVRLCI